MEMTTTRPEAPPLALEASATEAIDANRNSILYGIIAEFDTPEELIAAAEKARDAGFKRMDAYAPFPVEGLSEAMGFRDMWVPTIMFLGGLIGCAAGFGLLTWATMIEYPMNIGGRPLFGWPSFIPITFETTVLTASLTGIFGMFLLNGLPQPYHPVFNAPNFEAASGDRFFLCIEARDPRFDRNETRQFLEDAKPLRVSEVMEEH